VAVGAVRSGQSVVVRVTDDGKGIPPELQKRIYDPFFTTKPPGEGVGLGLDSVRRLVLQHRGEIAVDSKPGRTEFSVKLPIDPGKI
jgi:signal transduction histidine kinase